jgi:alpha-ketoglutarate-dependent taurine dioxygenase
MSTPFEGKRSDRSFARVERKTLKLSAGDLVKQEFLEASPGFPLVIQPNADDLNLAAWAASSRELLDQYLLRYGAILFRGFDVRSSSDFPDFVRAIAPELLDYCERAAPRSEVENKIYTSTEFPADQAIPLHHEMSYSHNWPTRIWFYCAQPPAQGGATPIADERRVFELIPEKVKEPFIRKKVMYVRNYGEGVDLTWQEAFQTNDRSVVEEYCRRSNMTFEWRDRGRLRTRQVRQSIAVHPVTGDKVWFNHAHIFHLSSLDTAIRESLLQEFKEDEVPRNAFYGDGSAIEEWALESIREVHQLTAVVFPWRQGDILMLDNFLASHGRQPYTPPRQILVAMSDLYTNSEI